ALAAVGDRRAIEPLVPLVVDQHPKVRLWGAKAIRSFGAPGLQALIDNMATGAPYTNLVYLDEAGGHVTLRQEIKEILARSGKEALPLLIAALGSEDRNIRVNIPGILGRMETDAEEALPAMIAALELDDPQFQANLIAAMAKVGDLHPDVMPTLKRLTAHPNKRVAKAARRAKKTLEKAARDKKPAAQKRGGVRPGKAATTPGTSPATPRQRAAAGETPAPREPKAEP
ncbi:MAG: HEAT repeat domain-containing protein, partial [Deltaproteobacteria bacterium]|nr:HEAT repeat domain-containing protein [Deltaproteobacteria bacterium]